MVADEPLFGCAECACPYADIRVPRVTVHREAAELSLWYAVVLGKYNGSFE